MYVNKLVEITQRGIALQENYAFFNFFNYKANEVGEDKVHYPPCTCRRCTCRTSRWQRRTRCHPGTSSCRWCDAAGLFSGHQCGSAAHTPARLGGPCKNAQGKQHILLLTWQASAVFFNIYDKVVQVCWAVFSIYDKVVEGLGCFFSIWQNGWRTGLFF